MYITSIFQNISAKLEVMGCMGDKVVIFDSFTLKSAQTCRKRDSNCFQYLIPCFIAEVIVCFRDIAIHSFLCIIYMAFYEL